MEYDLKFGKSQEKIILEDNNLLGILIPNATQVSRTGVEEIRYGLLNPIGSARLKDIVRLGEKVVIVTSDITRPMPSKAVLPEVLRELYEGGICKEDITIVFGLGSHRKHTNEEKMYLVGEEIYSQINCIDSDVTDFIDLGRTPGGTPLEIFRPVAEADRVVCLGNIEYHYFAGYSGGAKAIMPGVSTRRAIQANHSMMVGDAACAGAIESNPVREDIDEVGNYIKIDFILNVILDEKKTIIKAVAGNYIQAHRVGCRFLDSLYKVKIEQTSDIVVVSAGGYPKDINLYQAQKALDNATHAVRKGGIIILVASCIEGLGERVFEQWMLESTSPEEMVERIKVKFELGGHKAAAIGLTLKTCKIFLVSDLPYELVYKIYMEPFSSTQEAINTAFNQLGFNSKVLIIPYGGSTLPYIAM